MVGEHGGPEAVPAVAWGTGCLGRLHHARGAELRAGNELVRQSRFLPWYDGLFSEDERAVARHRLVEHGFDVDGFNAAQVALRSGGVRPRQRDDPGNLSGGRQVSRLVIGRLGGVGVRGATGPRGPPRPTTPPSLTRTWPRRSNGIPDPTRRLLQHWIGDVLDRCRELQRRGPAIALGSLVSITGPLVPGMRSPWLRTSAGSRQRIWICTPLRNGSGAIVTLGRSCPPTVVALR